MDVFTAIGSRHSYRGPFTDKKVSREELKRIVLAGVQAPSGCNAQTTSFVIVDDPHLLARIAEIMDKPVFRDAKAVIVCVLDQREVYHGMSFGVEDCATAVENMLLAITDLGYATVWMDGALRIDDKAKKIADILGVPANLQVRVVLPIGEPKEKWSPREKKPLNERAWFNKYGAAQE